ncbi:SagB/ThcOx family dehydrogenase [Paraliomyxa miuraensis]|uniref:SagB/ThcOx family dehydrogenase n=1 Tax=Paraliomyxa miuraensis TaxID=376150 RepID=UPI00224D44AA|nr:SagB family peptide dehydrogenase [Paraliomyxa miuraensis]MCX4247007.1 SagB family peptide dehydrogenase [Paraliomyxa miuraensis]
MSEDLREVFRLCAESTLELDPLRGARVRGPAGRLVLGERLPGLDVVLERIATTGATGRELLELHRSAAPDGKPTEMIALLGRLARGNVLCRTLEWQGSALLTVRASDASRGRWAVAPEPAAVLQLSRFVRIHREGTGLWLESPLTSARVHVHDRRVAASLHDLASPSSLTALAAHEGLPGPVLGAVVGMLLVGGFLVRIPSKGLASEDAEPGLGMWDPVELLAHHRARQPRSGVPIGKHLPFAGRFEPPPVLAPPCGRERIALASPDLDDRRHHDPPLAAVMEQRRSRREHATAPIDVDALAELLFRTLRARAITPGTPDERQGRSDRPYPSAGASHPLEAYLAVGRCEGLDRGFYHYHPQQHALYRVETHGEPVQALLRDAMTASGAADPPQVLLVLGARFGRTAWAYGHLAHRLILQEVGVVLQSVYLVATAMGLAACALGTGDSSRFAAITGLDPRVEASVGEIMLGSAPAELE